MKTQGNFKYIYKGEEVSESFWNTSTSGTVTFYDGTFYRATPIHKVLEKSIDSRIKEETRSKLEKLDKDRGLKVEELRNHFKERLSNLLEKDDVITSSSRGERETLEGLKSELYWDPTWNNMWDIDIQNHPFLIKPKPVLPKKESSGIKETDGKLYYELSWEFIEEMAKRMANNKSDKYPLYNWKKSISVEDLKQAINRHHIEVMKGNYKDGDEILGHIVSYACNSMMLWEQLKNKNNE